MAKYPEPIGEGAIWERTSEKGNEFFSGSLEFAPYPGAPPLKVRFAAFENTRKTSDRQPDYKIFVNSCEPAIPREKKPPGSGPAPTARQDDSEDLPF